MPRPRKPNAVLAAATRVRMTDPKRGKEQMAPTRNWHAEAWGYFDGIPEIKESVRYRGNQLGKLKLFCAVDNPLDPDGDPVPVTDEASGVPPAVAEAAEAELHRLRSAMGGQAEILRMLDMNLEVAGECYLVGYGERQVDETLADGTATTRTEPENWMIRSVSEVSVQGSGVTQKYLVKKSAEDKGTPLDKDNDDIMRIWLRHPQWADEPDCAMRALLGDCRILQVLGQQLLAHVYRALSAGLLTVPNELSFGPANPTLPEDPTTDPLNQALDIVLGGPVDDPSDPHTVQPGVLRGPAEYLQDKYLRRIKFYDPELVADIEAKITARVERIARGLNLPVEKVMGHQETTYANAAQVDQDEFNDYLAPSADIAVDALTYAFLSPQLREAGVDEDWVGRIFVWYDPTDLFAKPNATEGANDAHDRGTISDAAYRKAKGYGEDDAPEEAELLRRMLVKRGSMSQRITVALYEMLGIPVPISLDDVPATEEGERTPVEAEQLARLLAADARPRVLQAASRPVEDYGRHLVELDRDLRTRLLVETSMHVQLALDRAANRLRSKTNGSSLRATLDAAPRHRWFAQLGPTLVAEAMGEVDPLDGAWDALEGQFRAWVAAAQAEARTVVAAATGEPLTAAAGLDDLAAAQADDLAGAWTWMADALTDVANERLWTPDPVAPPLGEFDPDAKTPPGLVRQALARAGGAQGLMTSGSGDAWVALMDGGTRPAGGIGTGEAVRRALRDGGAGIEGYRWVYGPAYRARTFQPHLNLNGKTFVNFDDDVLANHSGWPPLPYYLPGDHNGCICDFEPVIIPAAAAA